MKSDILASTTPKTAIKQREGRGNTSYPYVEWAWANSVLMNATENHFDFKIRNQEIINVRDLTETRYNQSTRKKETVLDKDGNPKMIPQPPVLVVSGSLTLWDFSLPEGQECLGTREGFGSAVLMGPSDQWGDMFKSAASDCLKKCAQLFGVGLDLSGDLDQRTYEDDPHDVVQETVKVTAPTTKVKPPKVVTPAQETTPVDFEESDLTDLRNLFDSLGIDPNDEESGEVSRVIMDFSGEQYQSLEDINPSNVKSFNRYLNDLLNAGTNIN
jgi:hypothetical protein